MRLGLSALRQVIGLVILLALAQAPSARGEFLFVTNVFGGTVSDVTPSGQVSTFASGFYFPHGLAFNAQGDLFVADLDHNSVKVVTPAGQVSTFVSGIFEPGGLAFDAQGDLFVSNIGSNTISRVTPTGQVSTFASLPGGGTLRPGL
jgi:sugar lactone lactonase YvrE